MIRIILEKKLEDDKTLLTEPDEVEGDEEEAEASFGGVAGVSVPLGAGPNYPNKTRRAPGTKSPTDSASSSFGNAKVVKQKK